MTDASAGRGHPSTPWPEIVADTLRLDGARIELRPLTTGKFNTSFRVDWPGGRALLRIAPPDDVGQLFYERRMMRQEPGLHRLLRQHTSAPVPRVLAFDESRSRARSDFILLEWLPGRALSDVPDAATLEPRVFHQVGRLLAEVHAIHGDHHGYVGAHRPMTPASAWRDAFETMWNLLLDDVAATDAVPSAEIDGWRREFDLRRDSFPDDIPASMLHMDVWHQNLLVDDDGALTGFVDWDRALWGDPEIEFAVLDYCGVSIPEFWAGYGRDRDESPPARERWRFYLLYEMLKYIPIRVWRDHDPARAATHLDRARRVAGEWSRR